jgi:hypothetical protein
MKAALRLLQNSFLGSGSLGLSLLRSCVLFTKVRYFRITPLFTGVRGETV